MARSFAIPITLLALLGSVACQNVYAPSTSPAAVPPSPSPSSPNAISSPPSQSPPSSTSNPPTYPPSSSPPTIPQPSASSPMAYPPSPSPLMSSTPPINPPEPSPLTNPPSTSPLGSTPPTYPPNPSPPTYAPSPSPSSSVPPSYPPSASPPVYPSPSPSPSVQSPSTNPTPSPSPSPTSSISSPPNYPPSVSPSPSPTSSISSPPNYPPSVSPSPSLTSSISSPPNYPPSASPGPSPAPSGLSVGYYRYSCPNAESIVRNAVKSATDSNRGTGAGLIRLFFHDCFVQGCDASVLLNTTGSTQPTERASAPNLSLRGFEVIDAAKAALEAACPGVVSCADIVAFAGRDATFFLSGGAAADFDMPAGRYDGRVSLDSEALANLPPPFAGLQDLKDMFAAKGLDADDMVTLSGAHTVGRAHCSSFSDRLPPNASDMNATLAARLAPQCNGSGGDPAVPQDLETPDAMDSQYYRNVINHEVLFASDAALLASNQTAAMVSANAFTPGLWESKFKAAMVKMGRARVKTSADGEIRKKCWMVNQ